MMPPERRPELERFCADAYPQLVAALTHHCGDRELAQEFAQEALVKACRRWSTVQSMDAPVGWCYRVGVNMVNSWFRRKRIERRIQQIRPQNEPLHRDPDGAETVAVRRALDRLTQTQREAIICRYYLDLSAQQTAEVLRSTPGAVRAATHRAVQALRDVLDITVTTEEREATDAS